MHARTHALILARTHARTLTHTTAPVKRPEQKGANNTKVKISYSFSEPAHPVLSLQPNNERRFFSFFFFCFFKYKG